MDKKPIKVSRDPEGAELKHLSAACRFPGKSVLEIGVGNGVLVWQYAHLARWVVGIDPDKAKLEEACRNRPPSGSGTSLIQAKAEILPFAPGAFNIVLFASSL